MKVTLWLDEKLMKKASEIAAENGTTLAGLICAHLEQIVAEHEASGRKQREQEALESSFQHFRFRVDKKTWNREHLHVRS